MALIDTTELPKAVSPRILETESGTIRPFAAADAPRVAEILLWAFQGSTRAPSPEMVAYIRRLFLETPWADPDIYARVMQLPDGRISGFAGLMALPMRVGDRRLRFGVTSSLSVDDRIGDHMTGPRLVRHMRNGAQDGVLSDRSSVVAAAISRQLRSDVLHNYSLDFTRILRPGGYALDWLNRHVKASRAVLPLLRPLARPFDRRMATKAALSEGGHWAAPGKTRGSASFRDVQVSVDEVIELLPLFFKRYTAYPDFESHHWRFILEDGSQKREYGSFYANSVVSPSGDTVGLYLYHVQNGGAARLLHAFAIPGKEGVVLDRLFGHAMDHGAVAIEGRATPTFHRQLMDRQALFHTNMWAILYSKTPDVSPHFQAGTALFTGLIGENWIRLAGDGL